jgi:very-short-patch-repair endonuclease
VRSVRRGDEQVARIAARQHRALTREQILDAGLSRDALAYRVAQCRIQLLWRGVYLLGPAAPGLLSLAMGAVLITRGTGVLSYRWAAWLWGFAPRPELPVDVTVTAGSRRGRPQVKVHQARTLDRRDTTRRNLIPVTTPARTCLDLAETLDTDALERLVAEAQVVGAVRHKQLQEVIARHPGRRGAAALRAVLDTGPMLTRHESERLMFALIRQAGLPRPETNARVGRYRPDFLYRTERLIIEVDGWGPHHHRRAFENDRRRGAELTAAGYRVMHVTYRQLTTEPVAVAARIAAALAVAQTVA